MSNALAVAGVTAVLQYFLNAVYNSPTSVLGSVSVSAVAPDIVQKIVGTATTANLQVNLFLHQVTLNTAWRNMDLPSLAPDGTTRLTNQALALDLHYLLTAYAPEDSQAEALLGSAVLFLHETPVLARSQITTALGALPSTYPATYAHALAQAGLADQIEMIKITPATLGREELVWLWTALKADYRPTFPFQVSVVLIQPQNPLVSPLPVLQRRVAAQPNVLSPFPTLIVANPPNGQPAATLGDIVTVQGSNLNGASDVVLVNAPKGIRQTITPLLSPTITSFQFAVPNPFLPPPQPNPTDLPAGIYVLTAQIPSGPDTLETNGIPLAIAPKIDPASVPGTLASGPNVTVSVSCAPYVRPSQQAFLLIGSQAAPADWPPNPIPTNSPSFTFPLLQPTAQPVPVRLRVDGIDSPIIDMTQTPHAFSGPSVQVT
jgi:Pvc16 N-terminal domain